MSDRLALHQEWLEVTGDGGFACGTFSGEQTRRYHSYYITGVEGADERRFSTLSRVDEILRVSGEVFELGRRAFRGGVQPDGSKYISELKYEPWPRITYTLELAGGETLNLIKEIVAIRASRGVVLSYELQSSQPSLLSECELELELFFDFRPYHALLHQSEGFCCTVESPQENVYTFLPGESYLPLTIQTPEHSSYIEDGAWYKGFSFKIEKERGYDFEGDIYRAGRLKIPLCAGQKSMLHYSCYEHAEKSPIEHFLNEEQRRIEIVPVQHRQDRFLSLLMYAVDDFLVVTADQEVQIVAGFPWFVCWGRDTMISLPGVCLVTNRFQEAKKLLSSWAASMNQGLIPNRLSTSAGPPDYNTADASLWYLVAAYRYYAYSADKETLKNIVLPAADEILKWHRQGTLFGIHVDKDGLLLAGTPDTQLTWMDAMYDGVPVTPRNGKAVEINALWVNALYLSAYFKREVGDAEGANSLIAQAKEAHSRFRELFWRQGVGYFADVVMPQRSASEEPVYDISLRPNQLLALSLPVPLASPEEGAAVLQVVREHLLTRVGLRTLSPVDPRYCGQYAGDLKERDESYHQGTVWPYLTGGFITALKRYGDRDGWKAEAQAIFENVESEFSSWDVPGSLNEIYDGDEPHDPRGAFAQAWSVAEVLRAYYEDFLGHGPDALEFRLNDFL